MRFAIFELAKSRKIAEMKFPVHGLRAILKFHAMFAQKFLQMIFVAAEIAKCGGVLQREFQRLQRMIKTDQTNFARQCPVARKTVSALAAAPRPTSQMTNSPE